MNKSLDVIYCTNCGTSYEAKYDAEKELVVYCDDEWTPDCKCGCSIFESKAKTLIPDRRPDKEALEELIEICREEVE